MSREDPFKKRKAPVQVQDPAKGLKQHGIHGSRQDTVPHHSGQDTVLPLTSRRLLTVPTSAIRPGRYQSREYVDPEKFQQLKDQIQNLGFNFVAVLCKDPDDPNYYNPMMGGHLRIQAAMELGITEVSAILRDYNRIELAKGTYFENNGRQPLSLVDEGLIFKACQDDLGWTQEEVAKNLLVPGGRSHVALCVLTVTAAPDIQEMLRKDPKRGSRCFYYLRQLDVLGDEKAISLRGPIIQNFLDGKLKTDEVDILVKQILQREQGKEGEQPVSLDQVRRQNKITSTVKSFHRFEKEIGESVPSPGERDALLKLKERIEEMLARN